MDLINSCRCCLQCPPYKDLATPYTHLGKKEMYADMLKDCFDIHLTLDAYFPRGICLMCVNRLRDASDFKLQVQCRQTELQAALLDKAPNSAEPMVKSEIKDGDADDSAFDVFNEDSLIKSESPDDKMKTHLSDTDDERPFFEIAIASSSREKPYAREECNNGFKNKSVVKKRLQETHLSPEASCDLTKTQEKNNGDPGSSTIHKIEKKEHGANNFTGKAYLKRSIVKTLLNGKHCSFISPNKSKILRHQRVHTDEKPFMCNYCGYQCSSKKYLESHLLVHTDVKPFNCSICDYKCKRQSDLRLHASNHTGEKRYQCSQCDYKCNNKSHLQRHEGIHPGMKNKSHKCTQCDYQTIDISHLKRHLQIHTSVMPFKCDLCDYQCRTNYNLNFHKMTHTGEKPHKCSYCDFRCVRKADLPAHQRIHTGEKPYRCNHCRYSCRQKHALVGHIKSKHPSEQ